MTINELIKNAIKDPKLRSRFLEDPHATCREYGVPAPSNCLSLARGKEDLYLMQGGYRP